MTKLSFLKDYDKYTKRRWTLNPLYQSMWFSEVTQQLWLGWVWQLNEKNEAFPYLVTELPSVENGGISEDGTQVTMHLRDDLKGSDNEPVTSEDFKFTWEMAIDTKNTVSSAYPYDNITRIDTPDAQTVVINFAEPFSPWLANLWQGILPSHIADTLTHKPCSLQCPSLTLARTAPAGGLSWRVMCPARSTRRQVAVFIRAAQLPWRSVKP